MAFHRLIRCFAALVVWACCLSQASAQTVTYFHNDAAGTPLLATDASGAVVWKENYKPYGERLNTQPASASNQLWFTGKPQDEQTGLVYMGARYYDPAIGRFMGLDPEGLDPQNLHSFNRYAYANNNPYKYVDPEGNFAIPMAALAIATGVVAIASTEAGRKGIADGWAAINRAIERSRAPDTNLQGSTRRANVIMQSTNDGEPAKGDGGKSEAPPTGLGETKPEDAPSGTLGLDQAGRKHRWDKDTTHGIKDAATGGMAGGKTWIGVAPDGTVGINDGGKWSPQGHFNDLKP